MSTLYDLIDDYQRFSEILECEDTDEAIKDDLKEAVDNLAEDVEAKIDDYGKAISNRKANIAARKAEIERLQALNDADNRAIDRMKGICEQAMRITGKPKVKTTFYNFYFQKNPESVVLEEGISRISLRSSSYIRNLRSIRPLSKRLLREMTKR